MRVLHMRRAVKNTVPGTRYLNHMAGLGRKVAVVLAPYVMNGRRRDKVVVFVAYATDSPMDRMSRAESTPEINAMRQNSHVRYVTDDIRAASRSAACSDDSPIRLNPM